MKGLKPINSALSSDCPTSIRMKHSTAMQSLRLNPTVASHATVGAAGETGVCYEAPVSST